MEDVSGMTVRTWADIAHSVTATSPSGRVEPQLGPTIQLSSEVHHSTPAFRFYKFTLHLRQAAEHIAILEVDLVEYNFVWGC